MEGVSFLGPRIPSSVLYLSKHIDGLEKQTFRNIVQVIVSSIEGKDIPDNILDRINRDTNSKNDIELIFAGLHEIIRAALRTSAKTLKENTFLDDLKTLKIPTEFIEDLKNVIYGKRRILMDEANLRNRPSLPMLTNLRWRVDVTISTSYLNRVLQPSLSMEMTLSNGETRWFEVPISKFHLLRYNVANVLKEMEETEKKNLFKMQD